MDLPENNNGGVFSLTTAVTDHREKAKLAAQNAYGVRSSLNKNTKGNASNLSLKSNTSLKSKSSERSKISNRPPIKPTPLRQQKQEFDKTTPASVRKS